MIGSRQERDNIILDVWNRYRANKQRKLKNNIQTTIFLRPEFLLIIYET